jgi:hypothetical protein
MSGNSNSVLKTIEVSLTENEIKKFDEKICPNCLSQNAIDEYWEHFERPNKNEVKFYTNCEKCGQKYTHVFRERYITHFISFNEKGEKVYTCQEKTLRTANTKKNEQNLRNEGNNI